MEAYAGITSPEKSPVWIALDPTPVAERKQSIARVGGFAGNFRPITDSLRHIWIFYVIGYDGDRQDRLIYAPMRTIAKEIKDQYLKMGSRIRRWFARIFHFENVSSFISVRGFFVSFLIGLFLVGAGKARVPVDAAPVALAARSEPWTRVLMQPGTLFYRRLAQMLGGARARAGTERKPRANSPSAPRKFISAGGPQSESVADVPGEVVDAFYRIRFGHLQLEPESLEAINSRLDALELRLKSP